MPNTYSKIFIQIVFVVKGRENLIHKEGKQEVNKYISGIISSKGQKSIIVNGMPNHIHAFVGLKPDMSVSDLAREIKNNSTRFINQRFASNHHFAWQTGFGAFSYAESQVDRVYNYILNQEEHHKKKTFKEEYLELLHEFQIEYDERYLFDFVE